jgi:hypothetical protein
MSETLKEPLPLCVGGCGNRTVLVDAADNPWCQSCDEKSRKVPTYPFVYQQKESKARNH